MEVGGVRGWRWQAGLERKERRKKEEEERGDDGGSCMEKEEEEIKTPVRWTSRSEEGP